MDGVVGHHHLQTLGAAHLVASRARVAVARANLARADHPQAHLNHAIGYGK